MSLDDEIVSEWSKSADELANKIKDVINNSKATFGAKMYALENVLIDLAITDLGCENTFITSLDIMKISSIKEFEEARKQARPSTT